MLTRDFDFLLPPELIAQSPAPRRDGSRLLVHDRATHQTEHHQFRDILRWLRPQDVLVVNDSRVIPARLRGRKERSGGEFELLLLEEAGANCWWAMVRPGKRARLDTRIVIATPDRQASGIVAEVTAINAAGHRCLRFTGTPDLRVDLERLGETPLPPYIGRETVTPEDRARYQTVYAQAPGSVAAPTAGLHFTEETLEAIAALGAHLARVTLHVGPGTFAPVKADLVTEHVMHEERYELSEAAVATIARARAAGGRVIAVGTTSVRVLETVARAHAGELRAGAGRTNIFLHPPAPFHVVDALLTNFHLPQSTLLMLVSAFLAPGAETGREGLLAIYAEAIRERYRFFSYGDAMLIL
jgi:S-adenosylmethionine:tRNA ribosyltransferase-isomerase